MMSKPSALELSPDALECWGDVLKDSISIIPGDQHKVLLTHLLLIALSNGEKSLLLNVDHEEFQSLIAGFGSDGLASLVQFLPNWPLPKENVFNLLKQDQQKEKTSRTLALEAFEINYKKLLSSYQRLEKSRQALQRPIFGDLSWPDVLGLLWAQESTNHSIAHNPEGFHFTPAELTELLAILEKAQSLYADVQQLDHPLKQLHPQVFLKKSEEKALGFCQHMLKSYQLRLTTLIRKYQNFTDYYGDTLRKHLEHQTQFFLKQTDLLLDQIEDKVSQHGERFLEAKQGKTYWYTSVFKRGKTASKDYKVLEDAFQKFKNDVGQLRWFSFTWPDLAQGKNLAAMKTCVQHLETTLKKSHVGIGQFIQEEQIRLSSKSALNELALGERVVQLEQEMEDLLAELNETELLNGILEHKMLTLAKRKQYLTQLQLQLEHLEVQLSNFPAFYRWHRFWLEQSLTHQNLIRSLAERKSETWTSSFQNWYWQQLLMASKSIELPTSSLDQEDYYRHWLSYKMQLPTYIEGLWAKKRTAARKILQQNLKKNQGQIKNETWDAFTDLFPILAFAESAALNDLNTRYFDWLVVHAGTADEVSKASEDYLGLAKKVVIISALGQKTQQQKKAEGEPSASDLNKAKAREHFWNKFEAVIRPYFGEKRLQRGLMEEGALFPLVLKPLEEGQLKVGFVQDGFLNALKPSEFSWESMQQEQLRTDNWEIVPVWSALCWQNLEEECRKIAAQIIVKEKRNAI